MSGEEVASADDGFYLFGRAVFGPLARLIWQPRVLGKKNVPKKGPLIFASNHLSFIDSIAIPLLAPRRVQFLAKSSYFTGRGFNGWFQRAFFSAAGAVPLDRAAGQAAQGALEQSRRIIESGTALALYPEGTRSRDGRLYKGKTGVAWLALTTGAPVVPVGLKGTNELLPVDKKFPRFKRITVEFGKPLDLSHYGAAESGRARREATDEIMAAIQKLSGQEEAGVYNESPPTTTRERIRRVIGRGRKPELPLDE